MESLQHDRSVLSARGQDVLHLREGCAAVAIKSDLEVQHVSVDRARNDGLIKRGYACVALHMPKTSTNVGSALRAAFVYDARMIVVSGQRYKPVSADTTKAYRHIPFMQTIDVFDAIPYDCVPVAVDLLDGACPLPRYHHPERAFYIFGPEDGTLSAKMVSRCRDRVMVPTRACMNLAATVNVVLYDRLAKERAS